MFNILSVYVLISNIFYMHNLKEDILNIYRGNDCYQIRWNPMAI